jgi:D-lactate dehydrogenase (cytochrome)
MQVKTSREDLQNYLTDASNMAGGHAERLVIPESIEQVAEAVRDANENGTPVTISGARTGTVGGAIPFGGTVISLERLNNISIDREQRTATVGAGAILIDLQKAAESQGLFYPPDPTEWSCQVGGTVATNASGARSFKYGATRDYVRRLKVVLAGGEIIDIARGDSVVASDGILTLSHNGSALSIRKPTYERPRVRKNVSGYFNNAESLDAIDLFIGSEGTLGIIVEVELGLLPKPEGFFSGIAFFPDQERLLQFVSKARELSLANRVANQKPNRSSDEHKGLDATLLEYFDGNALRFIAEKFQGIPDGAIGAIFFEQETTAANEDAVFTLWSALLEEYGADVERSWFTTTEQDRERMRDFRHALPVGVNERIVRSGQRKVGTDMSVPDDRFASFLKFYQDTLSASGIDYVIFGHIGDSHLHANLLPKNEAEAEKARHIYGRCVAQAIMLGGCVSAEHGIGKLKRKYLHAMMGERYLNEMAEVKRAFDPKGTLSRGNMFDESYLNSSL